MALAFAAAFSYAKWPAGVEGDRRVLRADHGYYTVSMLDGGRTGLYYDVAEVVGQVRPEAQKVVLLGLGGGEMLRAARRTLPHAKLVGVELSPLVAGMAISEFHVHELGVEVVIEDALKYTREAPDGSIDALLVDVYDDATLPKEFQSQEFFRECRRALSSRGVLLMNVYPTELASSVSSAMVSAGFGHLAMSTVGLNVMVLAER